MLTKGLDNISGTSGNDTIIGAVDAVNAELNTLNSLDVINGGTGTDTLRISAATALTNAELPTISNVEVIEVSGAAVTLNTSAIAGVTNLNVVKATGALVATAATTTDIAVSGATNTITVDGGKDIVVNDATANQAIKIGDTTVNAGNITVTDTNVGTGAIAIDGGKDVTVTVTGSAATGDIKIGQGGAATDLPSGTVKVTSATAADVDADITQHAITIDGGKTIEVTQSASSTKAAAQTAAKTVTQGAVTIEGGNGTTDVTVTQTKSTLGVNAVAAVAGVTETASVKFSALTAGQTLILDLNNNGTVDAGDLQFKAAKNLTAAEVAQAFANLTNPDTQGSGIVANGVYTIAGATDFLTKWTSGAASGDTVVFTSTVAGPVTDLTFKGTGTAPTVTTTAGVAAVAAKNGVLGVKTGDVTINDNATTAAITTVTVDGYGTTVIGTTNTLSKLQTLNLSNSGSSATAGNQDATVTVDAAGVATLALNLNNVQGAVSLDGAADSALKTLNITATGADSTFALTAAAVETLTIAGDKSLGLAAGTFTALKSITVSGSAGATFDGDEADTLTSVNTSATTGTVTASIDGTKATYTGGAGKDVVTLLNGTALTKAINLGAGDDTLVLGAAIVSSASPLDGGDGIDTLSVTAAHAVTLSGAKQTFYTNFERLELAVAGDDDDTADTVTVNLENLGFTNYVTTNGTLLDTSTAAKSDTLVLDNLASGGTVVIAAAAAGANTKQTVQIKDAASGTADVLNLVLSSAGDLNAGTLTAANVETVNLTVTDTNTKNGINADALTLTADKATSVNVTGNASLTLTLTGSTAVTSIDASTLTGNLTVTSLNTTSATTIKGGAGNDVLTAATGTTADVLIGGAGNDTLVANAGLSTLTGGDGSDWFVIGVASQNVNSYATITDFGAGDVLQLVGADSFASAKVTLGDTAVFQDYANAAMNALDASASNAAGWFQFGGNTYVVVDVQTTDSTTFINGEDFIVKLTGLVDLSQASFNATSGTIALV